MPPIGFGFKQIILPLVWHSVEHFVLVGPVERRFYGPHLNVDGDIWNSIFVKAGELVVLLRSWKILGSKIR